MSYLKQLPPSDGSVKTEYKNPHKMTLKGSFLRVGKNDPFRTIFAEDPYIPLFCPKNRGKNDHFWSFKKYKADQKPRFLGGRIPLHSEGPFWEPALSAGKSAL